MNKKKRIVLLCAIAITVMAFSSVGLCAYGNVKDAPPTTGAGANRSGNVMTYVPANTFGGNSVMYAPPVVSSTQVGSNSAGVPVMMNRRADGTSFVSLGQPNYGKDEKPDKGGDPGLTPNAAPGKEKQPKKPNQNLLPDGEPVPPKPSGEPIMRTCPEPYWVDVYAPDYGVAEVTPLSTKKDQIALIGVNIVNNGRLAGTTDVSVKIGNETLTMTDIYIPAYGNHALSFGYYTPKETGTFPIEVYVNPSHPSSTAPYSYECYYEEVCNDEGENCSCVEHCNVYVPGPKEEYDYSDNGWTGVMNVVKQPTPANPDENTTEPLNPTKYIEDLPEIVISDTGGTGTGGPETGFCSTLGPGTGEDRPEGSGDIYIGADGQAHTLGNNHTETSWVDSTPTGGDKTYKAKLSMDVQVLDTDKPCTKLKSGYGFSLKVKCTIDSDYPNTEKTRIKAPKNVYLYIPDGGDYSKAIPLERTDGGDNYSRETTWELPENAASGIKSHKWYVPEWWSDGMEYNFLVASKGTDTPGGELTTASKHTIQIDSNMYTDDYSLN